MDQRMERLEERIDKLEERQQKHAEEFAETKIYVKHIYKKIEEIVSTLEAIKTKSSTRAERFLEKLMWVVLGIIATYIATELKLK